MNLNGTDKWLTLIPSEPTVVRYTNESLIVLCRWSALDAISDQHSTLHHRTLYWKSPKGDLVGQHRANRIHVEKGLAPGKEKCVSHCTSGVYLLPI